MSYWLKKLLDRTQAEPWNCVLGERFDLEFRVMTIGESISFWFMAGEKAFRVRIPNRCPFRVFDEAYLGLIQRRINNRWRTWKVHKTAFVRDLEPTILFVDVPEKEKFAYLIITGDECIEFIGPEPQIQEVSPKDVPEFA